MSEELESTPENAGLEGALPTDPDAPLDVIQDTMENLLATADVDTVYQAPVVHGDTLIIPAAEVVAAMGFGLGAGQGMDEDTSGGSGSGGGGGGKAFSRPVAVVISSPEGVRVEPVIDLTKVALAGVTAAAFMFGMLGRLRKASRVFED
jgi:uncharacterized spore protein YtfJ